MRNKTVDVLVELYATEVKDMKARLLELELFEKKAGSNLDTSNSRVLKDMKISLDRMEKKMEDVEEHVHLLHEGITSIMYTVDQQLSQAGLYGLPKRSH